jgi:hypothetical protein
MWFDARMQIRRSSLKGADRPDCPCSGRVRRGLKKVHKHDSYERYRKPEGREKVTIEVFRCVLCGQYFSVLPDDMLPYRPIGTEKVEQHFDAQYAEGEDPQDCTEIEKGCLARAVASFVQHTPSLCRKLGQMIKSIRPGARELWRTLRRLGGLKEILRMLSEKFKTSLLRDYLCLKPTKALNA